jgi:hypothetical protein
MEQKPDYRIKQLSNEGRNDIQTKLIDSSKGSGLEKCIINLFSQNKDEDSEPDYCEKEDCTYDDSCGCDSYKCEKFCRRTTPPGYPD